MRYMISFLSGVVEKLSFTFEDKVFAQGRDYGDWGMGPGMMGGWAMGWIGVIFMTAFGILVIVGLVFLIKWLIQANSREKDVHQTGSGALEILKERYAKGDIDKEEFEQKKKDLMAR